MLLGVACQISSLTEVHQNLGDCRKQGSKTNAALEQQPPWPACALCTFNASCILAPTLKTLIVTLIRGSIFASIPARRAGLWQWPVCSSENMLIRLPKVVSSKWLSFPWCSVRAVTISGIMPAFKS